jgi:hypothetical protein
MKYVEVKIPAFLFYLLFTAISFVAVIACIVVTLDWYQSFSLLSSAEKSLSSVASNITVQPAQVSLSLATDSFVYDEQGGSVVGDSLMSFNAGSNELNFGVSYPINSGKQKSVKVSLSGKRDGAKYLFTVKKARMIKSVEFQVSGLDNSLNWYLDGKRVIPSDDGILSTSYEFRQGKWYIILMGYNSVDGSVSDGVIIKIV